MKGAGAMKLRGRTTTRWALGTAGIAVLLIIFASQSRPVVAQSAWVDVNGALVPVGTAYANAGTQMPSTSATAASAANVAAVPSQPVVLTSDPLNLGDIQAGRWYVQVAGSYCKDATGADVWQPAGSPIAPGLAC
jgi:hypothetical protein